jgi:hypothetical protein
MDRFHETRHLQDGSSDEIGRMSELVAKPIAVTELVGSQELNPRYETD